MNKVQCLIIGFTKFNSHFKAVSQNSHIRYKKLAPRQTLNWDFITYVSSDLRNSHISKHSKKLLVTTLVSVQ
jgi:hypothetical protein